MHTKGFPWLLRFVAVLLLMALITVGFFWISQKQTPATSTKPASASPIHTVVLDAGHGGEAGGAVGISGLVEKDVNLRLTLLLRDLLEANGVEVILTRETDTMLYDPSSDYVGRKKALDLAERKRIAEETPDSVFVSIHMNTYPLQSCQGLQVWYSPNHPQSQTLAKQIQTTAQELLQPNNDRAIKAAGSSIYLLHRLNTPAVLVECGFLSSHEESAKLSDPAYLQQLAFTLFAAIMQTELSAE